MSGSFRLLMVSAMYENGGNVTHRLLDGHPQLLVYPFESQLGTRLVSDALSGLFPAKYRWPVFALDATPADDYEAILDEELRVRARTPAVSKFRHVPFEFSDTERATLYAGYVAATGRSRANNVAAFFRATFDAWRNRVRTPEQTVYVGYSPVCVVDAAAIMGDLVEAHILHVVRNPWSAYADTKCRPVPLPLERYMLGWTTTQHHVLVARQRFPRRVHVVRYEDIVEDPLGTLGGVCRRLGLEPAPSLRQPSWNAQPLAEVPPWGTIRTPTMESNRAAAESLSPGEREATGLWAGPYLQAFDYTRFL